MNVSTNHLQRQAETLVLAERQWEANRRKTEQPTGYSIAIAREAGTPGTSVGAELGKRLNWPVYDHALIARIADEMGLRTQLLDSVDEKRRSWLLEVVEGFSSRTNVSELSFVRHLSQTILSLGAHGDCVIVGRGAANLLPRETTLRVRLIGDREDRITTVSRRLNLSREAAGQWVAKTDQERQAFVKDHFLKDPTDPHHYDLVLNTSTWSLRECADLILHGLRELIARRAADHPGPAYT